LSRNLKSLLQKLSPNPKNNFNHQSKNKMKKFALSLLLTALAVCVHASTAVYPGVMWSVPSTAGYNVAVGTTGTNSAGVYTNNATTGVVLGATTNTFNLTYATLEPQSSQANTNLWPSESWSLNSTYPNTYASPANNLTLALNLNLTATNASSTTITVRYAATPDGVSWISNYLAMIYVVPINSTNAAAETYTNITTGAMAGFAIQAIENPGVATATNVVISANQKPGI
jgi:hypothetical protein